MSKGSNKRERHRLKRIERQRELKRADAGSPYRKAARSGEVLACYIDESWNEAGIGSLFVLRRIAPGEFASAHFLIDFWCCGLKDAYGRLRIAETEFREMLDEYREGTSNNLVRIDPTLARDLVVGAIRYADQNGFRLPARFDRWAAFIGPIDDWRQADLSHFGRDGKVCFVGNLEDLRRRLIGCSVDDFVKREEVVIELDGDDFSLLDDETIAADEEFEALQRTLLAAARQWCFAHGEPPAERLPEILSILIEATTQAECVDAENEHNPDATAKSAVEATDNIARMIELAPADEQHALVAAFEQYLRFYADAGEAAFEQLNRRAIVRDND